MSGLDHSGNRSCAPPATLLLRVLAGFEEILHTFAYTRNVRVYRSNRATLLRAVTKNLD